MFQVSEMLETGFSERSKMNPAKFGGFLIVNLLVCIWIGWLIDGWTNMRPFWIIAFALYAIVGSFAILLWKKKR